MFEYRAHVISVYDGDTCTVEVDLGFNVHMKMKVRLSNINAPEMRGDEREEGIRARDALRKLIEGSPVRIETIKDRQEKYGRYLAHIYVDECGEMSVNDWMVSNGHAKPYAA